MGLLDDAIREHLELKRRRGADPADVAREQHEALDPVDREAAATAGDDRLTHGQLVGDADARVDPPRSGALAEGARGKVRDAIADELPSADVRGGDETAELDMRTVLGDDHAPNVAGGVRQPAPEAPAAADQQQPPEEDSLEWEMPTADEAPRPEAAAPDEDVLEETPDFLRETPEQERLWFEQRPPRDFDFDK
jgi:hypothetical protein